MLLLSALQILNQHPPFRVHRLDTLTLLLDGPNVLGIQFAVGFFL
jgi:hypothetical protein